MLQPQQHEGNVKQTGGGAEVSSHVQPGAVSRGGFRRTVIQTEGSSSLRSLHVLISDDMTQRAMTREMDLVRLELSAWRLCRSSCVDRVWAEESVFLFIEPWR